MRGAARNLASTVGSALLTKSILESGLFWGVGMGVLLGDWSGPASIGNGGRRVVKSM